MEMTQCEKIYEYMLKHGTITQREAIFLGCYRLASRIFDLKKLGFRINTEMKKVQNKDGSTSMIAEYSLLPDSTEEEAFPEQFEKGGDEDA